MRTTPRKSRRRAGLRTIALGLALTILAIQAGCGARPPEPGPKCVVLMIGHRPAEIELYYPASDLARKHGAESPEPTPDPGVAYSDITRPTPIEAPEWPLK